MHYSAIYELILDDTETKPHSMLKSHQVRKLNMKQIIQLNKQNETPLCRYHKNSLFYFPLSACNIKNRRKLISSENL